jgi:hypothetical protein
MLTFRNYYVLWLLRCVQLRLVKVTLSDGNVVWCYVLSQHRKYSLKLQCGPYLCCAHLSSFLLQSQNIFLFYVYMQQCLLPLLHKTEDFVINEKTHYFPSYRRWPPPPRRYYGLPFWHAENFQVMFYVIYHWDLRDQLWETFPGGQQAIRAREYTHPIHKYFPPSLSFQKYFQQVFRKPPVTLKMCSESLKSHLHFCGFFPA